MLQEEEEDAAAQPAAAGSGAGVDAGAAQDGAVEELVDKASSLRLNAAALTQSQINDRDKWYKLLPPELKKMPHMRTHFNTMYAANADAAHEYVINAREQADQLVSRVNGQEFDLAKALSKPSAAGQLFAGEKAKNNPADVEGWLSSGSFYIAVKGVPEKWQFAYAFFTMLDVDARAVCFPDLKDTQPEQLLDGIYTWQDFCRGVLQSPLGGRKQTDLQIMYKCQGVRADMNKPDTMGIVAQLEGLFSRMQVQLCDSTKIFFVHRAVHPELREQIAYAADGTAWGTYAAFRANLVNHAEPFDQQIERKASRSGGFKGDGKQGGARNRRQQQRHQQQPSLAANGGVKKSQHSKGAFMGKCFNCGKPGHRADTCKQPKKQDQS
ncbi:hypothetical protein OEZ86_005056 [Tetradesmus obliquus]|nr:hypothetical protein OEZ86_005056 [Tetradesmus obliquus]